MALNTMTTALIVLGFAGGLTVGVSVLTVVRVPERNIEAEMTSALMNFDEQRRERDRLEAEAAKAESDKEIERVFQGWGANSSAGATLPWDRGDAR